MRGLSAAELEKPGRIWTSWHAESWGSSASCRVPFLFDSAEVFIGLLRVACSTPSLRGGAVLLISSSFCACRLSGRRTKARRPVRQPTIVRPIRRTKRACQCLAGGGKPRCRPGHEAGDSPLQTPAHRPRTVAKGELSEGTWVPKRTAPDKAPHASRNHSTIPGRIDI